MTMMILSGCAFLVITCGFGAPVLRTKWNDEDLLEKIFIALGIGLACIPLAGVLFDMLHIPLSYISFSIAAFLVATSTLLLHCFKYKTIPRIRLRDLKHVCSIPNSLVLIVFALSLFMYLKGSFRYEWFEDSDPWRYAVATKYIAVTKHFHTDVMFTNVAYPYPQGYQIIMAILSQINQSLNWTMKFFNSIIVSLSLFYFYYLAKQLVKNRMAAAFATIALASMPAWLTHFIFPMNLDSLFLPLFLYTLTKIHAGARNWMPLGIITCIAIWLTHFYSAVIITIFFLIYYLTCVLCDSKLHTRLALTGAGGVIISLLIFWIPSLVSFKGKPPGGTAFFIPTIKKILAHPFGIVLCIVIMSGIIAFYATERLWRKHLLEFVKRSKARNLKPLLFLMGFSIVLALLIIPPRMIKVLGSVTNPYSLNHFLLYNNSVSNLIHNPFGIGAASCLFGSIGLILCIFSFRHLFTKQRSAQAAIFVFALFTLLSVNGHYFSINLMPFRMWSFLAFSIALLIALFYDRVITGAIRAKLLRFLLVLTMIAALFPTWREHKYILNICAWNENYLSSFKTRKIYAWVKNNLPKNSRVYAYGIEHQVPPIIFDMISPIWEQDVLTYAKNDLSRSIESLYLFFKEHGYEYVVVVEASVFFNKFYRTYFYLSRPTKKVIAYTDLLKLKNTRNKMRTAKDKFKVVKEFEPAGVVFKIL